MTAYWAYGLLLRSEIPLPGPYTAESGGDVLVRLGGVDNAPPPAPAGQLAFQTSPGEIRIRYGEHCVALVREGREIVVEANRGGDDELRRRLVLGPALALLLHQRGRLVLHASAIALQGGTAAFVGPSGRGKSTAAAALHARGYPLIADDILAVAVEERAPFVAPGFSQQKLWPDVVESLGDTPDRLPRVLPSIEKRLRTTDGAFLDAPLTLQRIYVVVEGSEIGVEALSPRDAFYELLRNAYIVQVPGLLGATKSGSRHFRQCAKLAGAVPAARLRRTRFLRTLPEFVALIESDFRGLEGSGDR